MFATFKNNKTLLMTLNNLRNIYINHNHPLKQHHLVVNSTPNCMSASSASLAELYPYLDYIVEISNEIMNVKSTIEYFLDVKVN